MYLDIIVCVILLLAILTGATNGMYVEFISMFGLFLNIMLTKSYTPSIILCPSTLSGRAWHRTPRDGLSRQVKNE